MTDRRDLSLWWRGWAERSAAMTVAALVFCLIAFSADATASQSPGLLGLTVAQWLSLLSLGIAALGTWLCFRNARRKRQRATMVAS